MSGRTPETPLTEEERRAMLNARESAIATGMTDVEARQFGDSMWEAARDFYAERDRILRETAELVVQETLLLLPLEGDWNGGYRIRSRIDSRMAALPEEWASAAYQVATLHALLIGKPIPEPTSTEGER